MVMDIVENSCQSTPFGDSLWDTEDYEASICGYSKKKKDIEMSTANMCT